MRKMKIKKSVIALLLFTCALILGWKSGMWLHSEASIKICCIGDSITYGMGLSDDIREEKCYPAVLEDLLGDDYEILNYGVSGRTLLNEGDRPYRMTGYLEEVKEQEPDIIIVMLGSNDSKPENWDAKAYEEEYLALVRELKEIESEPKIYLMIPPRAFPMEDGEIAYEIDNDVIVNEIYNIVGEVSEESGTLLIDLYTITEEHPEYFMDGVHPNEQGYSVLAETIYEHIKVD